MTTLFDVAKKVESTIDSNRTTLKLPAGSLFYGDQSKIPITPCVCVESGDKTNELNGAPRRVMRTSTIYVLTYHSSVKSPIVNREEDDQFAESLETILNADAKMGGLVIDSMVTSIEFGYQVRSNTIYRASRLTFEARWQEQLPSS